MSYEKLLIILILTTGCTQTNQENSSTTETQNACSEKTIFNYPPVNLEKTRFFVPLGLMSGNHVTPVDHQYFQDFQNTEPNIEVYSPGTGVITDIQHMTGNYGGSEWSDYRLIINHGCGVESIFIHIDKLTEKILSHAPTKGEYKKVNIPVNAGEIIGYYQTNVDYNLVDQEYTRQGLLTPELYESEPWKIHVPDTLDYFTKEIVDKLINLSLRTQMPYGGKFDYDEDGKLIGNWFLQGTNGYKGINQEKYWVGHLSISPDYIDPEHVIVSLGNYSNTEKQFGVKGNTPNPATVTTETGMVKYELVSYDYYTPQGDQWHFQELVKGVKAKNREETEGIIIVQLLENRLLKVELFANSDSDNFTENALLYER